jgi:hypothetical protein
MFSVNYNFILHRKEWIILKQETLYYSVNTNLTKVTNNKEFIKSLVVHRNEMKEYIKEKRLKVSNKADAKMIFSYYNSL